MCTASSASKCKYMALPPYEKGKSGAVVARDDFVASVRFLKYFEDATYSNFPSYAYVRFGDWGLLFGLEIVIL